MINTGDIMKWIPWNVQTTDALFNPSDGMSISLLTFKHYMHEAMRYYHQRNLNACICLSNWDIIARVSKHNLIKVTDKFNLIFINGKFK